MIVGFCASTNHSPAITARRNWRSKPPMFVGRATVKHIVIAAALHCLSIAAMALLFYLNSSDHRPIPGWQDLIAIGVFLIASLFAWLSRAFLRGHDTFKHELSDDFAVVWVPATVGGIRVVLVGVLCLGISQNDLSWSTISILWAVVSTIRKVATWFYCDNVLKNAAIEQEQLRRRSEEQTRAWQEEKRRKVTAQRLADRERKRLAVEKELAERPHVSAEATRSILAIYSELADLLTDVIPMADFNNHLAQYLGTQHHSDKIKSNLEQMSIKLRKVATREHVRRHFLSSKDILNESYSQELFEDHLVAALQDSLPLEDFTQAAQQIEKAITTMREKLLPAYKERIKKEEQEAESRKRREDQARREEHEREQECSREQQRREAAEAQREEAEEAARQWNKRVSSMREKLVATVHDEAKGVDISDDEVNAEVDVRLKRWIEENQ